jgi:hypothetical protein
MITMTARRRLGLLMAVLVLGAVALLAFAVPALAAIPVTIAVIGTVLALVAGIRSRVRGSSRAHRDGGDPWAAQVAPIPLDGLRWTTTWDTTPSAQDVPAIRERAAIVLAEWDLHGECVEPSLLVITELLTNAIEHGRPPLRLAIGLGATSVRVEVHDAARQRPRLRPREDGRGRGLEIVASLALRHGWAPDASGKVVWADCPVGWPG